MPSRVAPRAMKRQRVEGRPLNPIRINVLPTVSQECHPANVIDLMPTPIRGLFDMYRLSAHSRRTHVLFRSSAL